MGLSAGKGTLLFFIPCSGGEDSQFAQTWNLYGRGIFEALRRKVRRTLEALEMEERDNEGTPPVGRN
jgi:hypothetical protein